MKGDVMESGDVVVLKSGGPKMTIGSIQDGKATCLWFVNDTIQQSDFPFCCIELAKKETKPVVKRRKKRLVTQR